MTKKIAVESSLSNVSEYLANKGYNVTEFQHNQSVPETFQQSDAIVTSGMDQDFLGMHDIKTKAMVIDAGGLSPQQIEKMLKNNLI